MLIYPRFRDVFSGQCNLVSVKCFLFLAKLSCASHSIDICTAVIIKNIRNIHAVTANQIAYIFHFNSKTILQQISYRSYGRQKTLRGSSSQRRSQVHNKFTIMLYLITNKIKDTRIIRLTLANYVAHRTRCLSIYWMANIMIAIVQFQKSNLHFKIVLKVC